MTTSTSDRFRSSFRELPPALVQHIVDFGMSLSSGQRSGKTAAAERLLAMLRQASTGPRGSMSMLPVVLEQLDRHPLFRSQLTFTVEEGMLLSALYTGRATGGGPVPEEVWSALLGHPDGTVRLRAQLAMGGLQAHGRRRPAPLH